MDDSVKKNAELVLKSLEDNSFCKFLGLEFSELTDTHAVARIPFSEKFFNPFATVHGGVLFSVSDIVAGAMACVSGNFCTTVEGKLNYLLPGKADKYIYCESKVTRAGRHIISAYVEIKSDDGKLLDNGSFTFYRTETEISDSSIL